MRLTLLFESRLGHLQTGCLCDLGWPRPAAAWNRISVPQPEFKVRLWLWEHWILVARPWQLVASCVEMNFHREMESSETSKVFIRGKRAPVNRHTGWAQRESRALVVVWITFMGHFFRVFFGQSSCFAWFWVCIWFISGSSPVCVNIS